MSIGLQEVVALAIVVSVIAFATWRRWRRGATGNSSCSGCDHEPGATTDDKPVHFYRKHH